MKCYIVQRLQNFYMIKLKTKKDFDSEIDKLVKELRKLRMGLK